MRLHLIKRDRPKGHDVWVTEINVKLRGRRKGDLLDKIPKKLFDKLVEMEVREGEDLHRGR